MATISLTPQRTGHEEGRKKKDASWNLIFHPLSAVMGLFSAILLTSFLYLSSFNDLASQGVLINDLERKRSRLIIENEVWNMRIANLKSLDVIEEQDVVRRMESIVPEEIEFVDLRNL